LERWAEREGIPPQVMEAIVRRAGEIVDDMRESYPPFSPVEAMYTTLLAFMVAFNSAHGMTPEGMREWLKHNLDPAFDSARFMVEHAGNEAADVAKRDGIVIPIR
jgi:hypothetical protein